jgi:hypothetical protein
MGIERTKQLLARCSLVNELEWLCNDDVVSDIVFLLRLIKQGVH